MASFAAKADLCRIPLENLSLEFIAACQDRKQLEKIIKFLRAEEETFPHLLTAAEERLVHLHPKSLLLKFDKHLVEANQSENFPELREELNSWRDQVKLVEKNIKLRESSEIEADQPIRNSGIFEMGSRGKAETENKKENKVDWKEFDADKELVRLEVEEERMKMSALQLQQRRPVFEVPNPSAYASLTALERETLSLREKEKGNEFFKTGDFGEAIRYYSNSIIINPSVEAFNNRAMAYLKGDNYLLCLKDCSVVLSQDPNNVKALLRSGISYSKLGNRFMALEAFKKVLQIEPANKVAKGEMNNLEVKITFPGDKENKFKRPLIEDITDEAAQSNASNESNPSCSLSLVNSQRQDMGTLAGEQKAVKSAAAEAMKVSVQGKPETVIKDLSPFEFMINWRLSSKDDTNLNKCAEVLNEMDPISLPRMIGSELDGEVLSTLLHCIQLHFVGSPERLSKAIDLINILPRVSRFSLVSSFASDADKAALNTILLDAMKHKLKCNEEVAMAFALKNLD